MKKEGASESIGMFATILGILGLALPMAGFPFSLFFGSIIGLILSIISLVFAFKSSSWRKPAFILSILGILFNLVAIFWVVAFLSALGQQLSQSGGLEQLAALSGGAA